MSKMVKLKVMIAEQYSPNKIADIFVGCWYDEIRKLDKKN